VAGRGGGAAGEQKKVVRVVDLVGDRELSAVGLKGEAGMTTRDWNRTKFVLFLFFLCMFQMLVYVLLALFLLLLILIFIVLVLLFILLFLVTLFVLLMPTSL